MNTGSFLIFAVYPDVKMISLTNKKEGSKTKEITACLDTALQ